MKFRIKQIKNRTYPQVKLHWYSGWKTISKANIYKDVFDLFAEDYENLYYSYDQALEIINDYRVIKDTNKKPLVSYTEIT